MDGNNNSVVSLQGRSYDPVSRKLSRYEGDRKLRADAVDSEIRAPRTIELIISIVDVSSGCAIV